MMVQLPRHSPLTSLLSAVAAPRFVSVTIPLGNEFCTEQQNSCHCQIRPKTFGQIVNIYWNDLVFKDGFQYQYHKHQGSSTVKDLLLQG